MWTTRLVQVEKPEVIHEGKREVQNPQFIHAGFTGKCGQKAGDQ
jgi:hypothetical protein